MTILTPSRPVLDTPSTERITGWVALVLRGEHPEIILDISSKIGVQATRRLNGLMVPEGSFVAEDAETLAARAPGSGYLLGRVAARAEAGEVTEIIGTLDSNPQATGPEAALRLAAALGLPMPDPAFHMQMVGSGGIMHGGIDTSHLKFEIKEWTIDTFPRWVLEGDK